MPDFTKYKNKSNEILAKFKEFPPKLKETLVTKWSILKPKIIELYTGPARVKAIALTAASVLALGGVGFTLVRHLTSPAVHPLVMTVEASNTDAPECTDTDAATTQTTIEETTTVSETTTVLETQPVEETTAEPETTAVLTVIPVSQLDISSEDLSTNTEVLNRTQANYTPALPSALGNISSPGENYTTKAGFLTGIDVSKHQGSINWSAVKNDGIQFAIIKVAGRGYETGKLYYDSRYKENLKDATAAGIPVGVYFFSQATSVQEAREEASMIIDAIKGYNITYPVVFDWETAAGYRTYSGLSKSTMTAIADTFCSMVENAGYKAMIYANTFDWERYEASTLTSRYAAWLARYPANYSGNNKRFQVGDGLPSLSYPYQIWQYSDSGKVSGISENVDMNVAFVGFSGTSTPSVPMVFETPQEEYHISVGGSIDILAGVKSFNCAGILATSSMNVKITNASGQEVTSAQAAALAGKYTITYSLKDFTGYTGRKTVPLYVEAAPVITLNMDTLTVSRSSTSYEDLQAMISQNVKTASDFTGQDISSSVVISYPEGYVEEVYEEVVLGISEEIAEVSLETYNAGSESSAQISSYYDTSEAEQPESVPDETQEITTSPSETETTGSGLSETTETTQFPEETTTITLQAVKKLVPGSYVITYSVTDAYGLSSSVSATLIIQE